MSDNADLPPKPAEPEKKPEPTPVAIPRAVVVARKPRSLLPAIVSAFVLALVIGAGLTVALISRFPSLTANLSGAESGAPDTSQALVSVSTASAPASGASDSTAELRQTILALQARLDTADARLTAMDNRTAPAQSAAAAITGINTHLGIEDSRLASLEAAIARTAEKDALAVIEQRLGRLETQDVGQNMQRAAAVLARANLARAAQESQPFRPELAALMVVAPDDPAIAMVQPLAELGVPTLAMLQARFAPNARAALNADHGGDAGSIWTHMWASLSRLISVRRVGDVSGMGSAALLARAEADLGRNDLTSAVVEIRALSGAAATAMMPWLRDAEARLVLDHTVADLQSRIVQALAAAPAAGR